MNRKLSLGLHSGRHGPVARPKMPYQPLKREPGNGGYHHQGQVLANPKHPFADKDPGIRAHRAREERGKNNQPGFTVHDAAVPGLD